MRSSSLLRSAYALTCLVITFGCTSRAVPDDGGPDAADTFDAATDAMRDAAPDGGGDAHVPDPIAFDDVYGFADEPREHGAPLAGLSLAMTDERALFGDVLGGRTLSMTLVARDGDALEVRDRRTLDVYAERFLGGADWTDRFTTFFVRLDATHVLLIASRQRIEVLSLEGDVITPGARLPLPIASDSILAGAARGDRLYTCAGFALYPYRLEDDAITEDAPITLSGSCRGLSLSPDGDTLYIATTRGFYAADVATDTPVLGDALMATQGFFRVEANDAVLVTHALRNYGELGEIAAYRIVDIAAPTPTPVARFQTMDSPSFMRPIGFALTDDALFVEWYRFSSDTHHYDLDVHAIDDAPSLSFTARTRVRQTVETGAFVSPVALTARGRTVVLDPWRQVYTLDASDRLVQARGPAQGSLSHLWQTDDALFALGPTTVRVLSSASPPRIAEGASLGPTVDRLRIAPGPDGSRDLVPLPERGRSNVRTREVVTQITCLVARDGSLVADGILSIGGGAATLASVPGVLFQMLESTDGRYRIRRYALDAPCDGSTMTPADELVVDLGTPSSPPSGYALGIDAVTGDVLVADMIYDPSTATTRIRLGWRDAHTGVVAHGEIGGTTGFIEALALHDGEAIVLENGRELWRLVREGDAILERAHVNLGAATPAVSASRILHHDGQVVYLAVNSAPLGVLAVRVADLVPLARYEAQSVVESVAFRPDVFVMASASTIRFARLPTLTAR